MKKFSKAMLGLLCGAALAFAGCSGSDFVTSSSSSSGGSGSSDGSSVAVAAVETKGTVAAASGGVATLTDSNGGSYVFTASSASSSIAISASAEVDTDKGGTWIYKDSNGKTKYSGTYKGDIEQFGSGEVKLELKVEKAAGDNGVLAAVEKDTSFDFDAGASEFTATIPAVTVEAVASFTELAYDGEELNNKIFNFEDDDKTGETLYRLFTGKDSYTGDDIEIVKTEIYPNYPDSKGEFFDVYVKYDDKIYLTHKVTRTSGEGFYSTYKDKSGKDGEAEIEVTVKSDGTGVLTMDVDKERADINFTYTRDGGTFVLKASYEGEAIEWTGLYDGESCYILRSVLTFVENYTPSASDSGASGDE